MKLLEFHRQMSISYLIVCYLPLHETFNAIKVLLISNLHFIWEFRIYTSIYEIARNGNEHL